MLKGTLLSRNVYPGIVSAPLCHCYDMPQSVEFNSNFISEVPKQLDFKYFFFRKVVFNMVYSLGAFGN